MAEPEDGLDGLDEQVAALEESIGATRGVTAAFAGELARMRESLTLTGREAGTLSRSLGRGLRGAFDGLAFDGRKLSDALRDVGRSVAGASYSAAVKPVQNRLGGLLAGGIEGAVASLVPFGDGAGFAQGRVMPFARGGVVRGATAFPMRGGAGVMGEAGPEAIMPLARGADGKLGVAAGGGRPVQVTVNVTTPDAEGFRRSQGQIAAQVGRAIERGQRYR